MSGRIAGRAREWTLAQPGRTRALALTAAVMVAVAGGAVAVLGPDNPSSGRVRHERGAVAPPGAGAGTPSDGAPAGTGPDSPGSEVPTPGSSSPTGTGSGRPRPTGTPGAGATPGGTSGSNRGDPAATTGPDGRGTAPTTARPPAPPAGGGGAATPFTDGPGWRQLPAAPIGGRGAHTAVWTGREMVIWGGIGDLDESGPFTDGAAFDPGAGTWRRVPAAPLSPRFDPGAFWTGSEMVVYGGVSVESDPLADGAAWNPQSNTWRPIAAPPTGVRDGAVVAWAGDRLVVWGGATVLPGDGDAEPEFRNDGAAWVAATGTWVAVPAAPIPARSGAESAWTGSRLVVSGGYSLGEDEDRTDGAALDPASGAWSPIAARPAPGSCGGDVPCVGVWTGSAALFPGAGLAYDPAGDRWSAVNRFPAGDGLVTTDDTMVWTGRRLLVWGSPAKATDPDAGEESEVVEGDSEVEGEEAEPPEVTDDGGDGAVEPPAGFTYDPAGNRWEDFAAGPLGGRDYHSAVWTGQEMLVWGGITGEAGLTDGAAYRPAE